MKVQKLIYSLFASIMLSGIMMVSAAAAAPKSGDESCLALPSGKKDGIFAENTASRVEPQRVYEYEVIIQQTPDNESSAATPQDASILASQNLPFNFTFDFYANLQSRMFNNTKNSVKITIDDSCWVDKTAYEKFPNAVMRINLYNGATDKLLDYFDVPISCDGAASSYSVTFKNVPTGDIYFILSKTLDTYDYELKGTGTISNP